MDARPGGESYQGGRFSRFLKNGDWSGLEAFPPMQVLEGLQHVGAEGGPVRREKSSWKTYCTCSLRIDTCCTAPMSRQANRHGVMGAVSEGCSTDLLRRRVHLDGRLP